MNERYTPCFTHFNCLNFKLFYFWQSQGVCTVRPFGQTPGFCQRIQRAIEKDTRLKKRGNAFLRTARCESGVTLIQISLPYKGM